MTASRAIVLDFGQWWVEYHVGANSSTVADGLYTLSSPIVRAGTLLGLTGGGYGVNSSEIAIAHTAVNGSARPDIGVRLTGNVVQQIKNNSVSANTITGWLIVIVRKSPT